MMPVVRPLPSPFVGGVISSFMHWLTYSRKWELVEDYIFYCPTIRKKMIVPAGFILDFASIPWFLRWIPALQQTGVLLPNSVPHDFIYKHGFLFKLNGRKYKVKGRKEGDKIFKDVGINLTKARFINYLAYYILRLFGWLNYYPKPYDKK